MPRKSLVDSKIKDKLAFEGYPVDKFERFIRSVVKDELSKSRSNPQPANRFKAPSYDDVMEYGRQKGRPDLVDRFWQHYTENDPKWTDAGGKKVRNWKQKFLTWCSKSKPTGNGGGNGARARI